MTQYSRYGSVLRTIQKRMEATLGAIILPRDRNLRQLYAHCALNTCLYPFQCAIIALPLYALVGIFTLILREHRAATETCGAHDYVQGVVPMLSIFFFSYASFEGLYSMIINSNQSNIQRIHIYKNINLVIHVTYQENFRFFLYELTFSLYCSNKILTPISSHKTNLWHLLLFLFVISVRDFYK